MRNGRLVVEDSPTNLLERYNTALLEDIVLKLCLRDEKIVQDEEAKVPVNRLRRDSVHNNKLKLRRTTSVPVGKGPPAWIEDDSSHETGEVGLKFRRASAEFIKTVPREVAKPRPKQNYSTKSFDRVQALVIKNVLVMLQSIG